MTENALTQKLHPRRFPGMSGTMAAIVGYVLGEDWTTPEIAELHITSDGCVLARVSGDVGCNAFIGSVLDFDRNVRNLLDMANLTEAERLEWHGLYTARVDDWRNHR